MAKMHTQSTLPHLTVAEGLPPNFAGQIKDERGRPITKGRRP